jgi:tetratricopeptide (TPR) repeat protein
MDARNWLAQGEAAHFEAEHRLSLGDVAGARIALETAAKTNPPSAALASDARIVRQDLYAELALLELQHGRAEDGVRWATTGLDLGTVSDAFTANLQIARGKALDRLGDANGATRDYHAALVITESLLEVSLGHGSKTP